MLKKISKLNKPKFIILLILVIVVLFPVISETVAWLTKETNLLINKFTYGNIKISISEGNINDDDSNNDTKNYMITPGGSIVKDTLVVVNENSEDCWLFIKIKETDNFDDYMIYSLEDGWKELENNTDIYYREVNKSDKNQTFNIIKDNVINVKSELTKESFDLLTEDTYPSISISAYAVQRNSAIDAINTAEKAWLLVDEK